MLIGGRNFFFAPVGPDVVRLLTELADRFPDVGYWIRKSKNQFHAVGIRNEFPEEKEAFVDAFERLSGILDGYAFLAQDYTPDVWQMVQIREINSPDAAIKFFGFRGWVRLHSSDGVAEKSWEERTKLLLIRFEALFEAAVSDSPPFDSDLANQVSLSAKMYRHGGLANAYGIEFLCKFTALEGLVCGSSRQKKGSLLAKRLAILFRHRPGIKSEISALWKARCEASHQGKAFSEAFSTLVAPVEMLTLGAMVFAIDHLKVASSVDQLWNNYASTYVLPPEAIAERPSEIRRFAALNLIMDSSIQWKRAGLAIDRIWSERQLSQDNPTHS